jgi:hypothetical protein
MITKAKDESKSYHYWDFNGQLQARLNQAFGVIAALALVCVGEGGALFYTCRQLAHPPVIKIGADGAVSVADARPAESGPGHARFLPVAEVPPDEVEIKHLIRTFLERYLQYEPATADDNLAAAFNMMTVNLRQASLKKMRNDGEFEKIQTQRVVSNFKLVRIDPVTGINLAYTVLGVREIHRLEDGKERSDTIVAHYNVRLAPAVRTEYDPSGLRVADFWEEQVMGQQDKELALPDGLAHEAAARQIAGDADAKQR